MTRWYGCNVRLISSKGVIFGHWTFSKNWFCCSSTDDAEEDKDETIVEVVAKTSDVVIEAGEVIKPDLEVEMLAPPPPPLCQEQNIFDQQTGSIIIIIC